MDYFVSKNSIVRKIWGNGDTILFIFAGAAAEFALNKAVDWLYFTGRLPSDPLGRLFSTVSYARKIVFSDVDQACTSIDKITAIHTDIEQNRGAPIPDWAYRDVLFMLIDYSIRAYELLEQKMTVEEKQETFDVFYRVGNRMQIPGLPETYEKWLIMRKQHLDDNLVLSHFTVDLYKQYRKHLGPFRYLLLKEAQVLVVPERVNRLLTLGSIRFLQPLLTLYKKSRLLNLHGLLKNLILPSAYKEQIKELDIEVA